MNLWIFWFKKKKTIVMRKVVCGILAFVCVGRCKVDILASMIYQGLQLDLKTHGL